MKNSDLILAFRNEGLDDLLVKIRSLSQTSSTFLDQAQEKLLRFLSESAVCQQCSTSISQAKEDFVIPLAIESQSASLYLISDGPGIKSLPHTHHTWAVIVGIRGIEQNIFYELEDGHRVQELRRCSIGPGMALLLKPTDIHSTETVSEVPTLHLHLYGKPLHELLPFQQRVFDL